MTSANTAGFPATVTSAPWGAGTSGTALATATPSSAGTTKSIVCRPSSLRSSSASGPASAWSRIGCGATATSSGVIGRPSIGLTSGSTAATEATPSIASKPSRYSARSTRRCRSKKLSPSDRPSTTLTGSAVSYFS